MKEIIKNSLAKGIVTQPLNRDILDINKEYESIGIELKAIIEKRFMRSFHIREVDTGSCGACEAEIIAAANSIYDVQRFGIDFVASPRHADALLVTGPVSKNMLIALHKTYEAVPCPKFVISLGDCALNGGIFKNSYYVEGGVNNVLPVNLHIPGCPPEPLTIIKYLLNFLKK